jgi:hypothetical protein
MRAAPNPRILTGWSGASPHVLRFPRWACLRFPVCPPGSSPSSAFLRFPLVRRSPVRSLRPLPGSGSLSVSLLGPFPLSDLHGSAAPRRFRRRWSRAAGTKVTSNAAPPRPIARPARTPDGQQPGTMGCRHRIACYEPPRAQDTAAPDSPRSAAVCAFLKTGAYYAAWRGAAQGARTACRPGTAGGGRPGPETGRWRARAGSAARQAPSSGPVRTGTGIRSARAAGRTWPA